MMAALREWKHLVLLAAVLGMLVSQPFLAHGGVTARLTLDAAVLAVAIGVILIVLGNAWERYVGLALALPAVAVGVGHYAFLASQTPPTAVAFHLLVVVFLGFAVVVIVRDIFRKRTIRLDDILGAFTGYLLLGVLWGNGYAAAALLAPDAFSVNPAIQWQLEDWHLRRALFNYFSLAILSSLGYSDVTPISPLTNTLTWLEVMSGQFYMAVVIAQIIGLKLASVVRSDRADPGPFDSK
jgi:hypothetical protein